MGNRPLAMTFIDDSGVALEFAVISVQHGTTPGVKSGTNPVENGGQILIQANNVNDLAPGPQGSFSLTFQDGSSKAFIVNYVHPLGTGSTSVDVQSPSGYTATMTVNNLAHESASCVYQLLKIAS